MDMDKDQKDMEEMGVPCAVVATTFTMMAGSGAAGADTCFAQLDKDDPTMTMAMMYQMAAMSCCTSMASVCDPYIASANAMCNADQMNPIATIKFDDEDGPVPCGFLRA